MNNNNTTNTTGDNNPFGMFDFSDATNNNQVNTNIKTPENIFQNVDQFPTTKVTVSYNQNDLLVCSQFQRNNGQIILGLHISKEGTNCQLNLDKNSFGLICQPNSNISNNVAFFPIKMDKSNSNAQTPSDPFIINGTLNLNGETINMKIEMNIIVLFIENSNLIGNPFVEFYSKNRDHDFNKEIYSYPKYKNEDEVKKIFEKKNILFSARQNKANPPPSYYSGNILGSMPFLIESCLNNDSINIKIIANNEKVAPLIKRAIDSILN